jgi:hypothetical protein
MFGIRGDKYFFCFLFYWTIWFSYNDTQIMAYFIIYLEIVLFLILNDLNKFVFGKSQPGLLNLMTKS